MPMLFRRSSFSNLSCVTSPLSNAALDGFLRSEICYMRDSPNSQKRWKSPMKSPIINWALHKKPQKQSSFEQLSPQGSFFGLPLTQFSSDDEQLPTPVEDMLLELFRRGPSTDGIFRKSALMKTVKQLRQELEEGKSVNFEEKSAVVIATIFKEFLRGLPSCAFGSEFLCEILDTNDITDETERIAEIDKVFNKLPKLNQILVKKFLCVLYHIARLSDINKMTSQNLAICIAPSLVWSSKAIMPSCAKETTAACELVQFMIDHYIGIFGEEATRVLGDESEIQPPVTYDDEDDDMPDNGQETASDNTVTKSLEDSRAKHADFTLSLRVPEHRIPSGLKQMSPENEGKSNTTPRIPNRRRFYDLKVTSRRHSENDLTDLNDNLPVRKLRTRVPLTSCTTSAELIKHNVNGGEDVNEPSSTVIRVVSTTKETSPVVNGRRKNSPSNHEVYNRKVRPTPSYEEAIRQLRRNAQFSPLFSQKSEERLESSDESIDQKFEEKLQDSSEEANLRKLPINCDDPVSPTGDISQKSSRADRQILTCNILSPTPDRLKSSRLAADSLRRSPEQIFACAGSSRHPSAPSYEQHLERRKRFETAYLKKINLDLNSLTKRKEPWKDSDESSPDGIDFTRSYNGTDCEKPSLPGGRGLATSLDSAGLRSLGLSSGTGGQNSVPLSNGIHTFITQRKNTNSTSNDDSRSSVPERFSAHPVVTSTVSASARLTSSSAGERDQKLASPLRVAIDVGSYMYRPSDAPPKNYLTTINDRHENGQVDSSNLVNGICESESERNNNDIRSDVTRKQPLKLCDSGVEDFDKLLSSLKSQTDTLGTNSSAESVGNLDVPSHEDIKTILCQDESYV